MWVIFGKPMERASQNTLCHAEKWLGFLLFLEGTSFDLCPVLSTVTCHG